MAGTLVLLAACAGDRPTAPVAQVQAFGGRTSNAVFASVGSVTPATATVAAGATQQFSAFNTAVTPPAQLDGTMVAWSVSGGGTIDAVTGLFTAGSVAGTFTVTATGINNVLGSATASVTVTSSTPTCTPDDDHHGDCDKADKDKDHHDNHDGKGEKDDKDHKDKNHKNNDDKGHGN